MRWICLPEDDAERIVTKFLWFPKTIQREKRWLETASYLQRYSLYRLSGGGYGSWSDVKWVDKEQVQT